MEEDITWDGKQTIQWTDDVLYNCTPETYVILLAKRGREGRKNFLLMNV